MVADLGSTLMTNDYVSDEQFNGAEPSYPLRARVCGDCKLLQLQDFSAIDNLFRDDYAYFSSYSPALLAHADC